LCQKIVSRGGDYIMVVKGNQPQLQQDLQLLYRQLPAGEVLGHASSHDKHGGRVEMRQIWSSTALVGYLDWPGAKQVGLIHRRVEHKGVPREQWVFLVTSLSPTRANASRILAINRRHWRIENSLHWVRDVVMGEDACRVRSGSAPQVLAAMRNTVIGLLHRAGVKCIASAQRKLTWDPSKALRLIGAASD
jgi:predicted transposase YbfD/YdcC